MKSVILALMVVLLFHLTTTAGFIDCRAACRKCREGFEDVSILEVYCSMCKECRDRRRERMNQARVQSQASRSSKYRQSFRTTTFYPSAPPVGRMNVEDVMGRLETWPENCPTPPVCEEIELLTKPRTIPTTTMTTTPTTATTTTTTPTTTTEAATCPPITTCRKKPTTQASCMPCTSMCPAPCPVGPVTIDININWNGKFPFDNIKYISSEERNRLKKSGKKSTATPSDWIENTPVSEGVMDVVTSGLPQMIETELPTTMFTTVPTTLPTNAPPSMPVVPSIPDLPPGTAVPPGSPYTCLPSPNVNSNPCCNLPIALQGQLSYFGLNCDPRQAAVTQSSSTANDLQNKIVLDEELLKKILLHYNNDGNKNSNGNGNNSENSRDSLNDIIKEYANNKENKDNNADSNGESILGTGKDNPHFEYPGSGIFDNNKKGGPSNNEYDIQKKIVINGLDPDLHRQIVINEDMNNVENPNALNGNKGSDRDKKKTGSPDQDYYYVYVGVPKNLVRRGGRRATTPDFPLVDIQIPQSAFI